MEAFDKENRDRVRYSVSTKIIESLASGRPLLAYGPEDVASMAYLRRNDCAALACSLSASPSRRHRGRSDAGAISLAAR